MNRLRLAVGGFYLLLTEYRSESIAVNKKNKRGRPPTGIGPVIGVRLYPEMQVELATWIERQPDPKPSRPEAIRRLIKKGLRTE
jgi:hypothetical protein